MTITRTHRKAIVDEIGDVITLFEDEIKIEIALPAIFQSLKNKVKLLFSSPFKGYCYVA